MVNCDNFKDDVLIGLNYVIDDTKRGKTITCICGTCDLLIEDSNSKKNVVLNSANNSIEVKEGVKSKIINCSQDAKINLKYHND